MNGKKQPVKGETGYTVYYTCVCVVYRVNDIKCILHNSHRVLVGVGFAVYVLYAYA